MRYYMVIAVAAACVTAPAAGLASSEPANRDNQVVCRRAEGGELGSHLRRAPRVCKTRAEWRELEDYTQRDLRSMSDRTRDPEEPAAGPRN
jgi:hypothetical protein